MSNIKDDFLDVLLKSVIFEMVAYDGDSVEVLMTVSLLPTTNFTNQDVQDAINAGKEESNIILVGSTIVLSDFEVVVPVIDPCVEQIDTCDMDAECIFLGHNTHNCSCNDGYMGDGYTCTDIDECLDNNTCSSNENCTNTIGSFICTCFDGFYKDNDDICRLQTTTMLASTAMFTTSPFQTSTLFLSTEPTTESRTESTSESTTGSKATNPFPTPTLVLSTESTTDSITETTTESRTESKTESKTEATTKATTDSKTEATTESRTESKTESETVATTEAITVAVTESTIEKTTKSLTESIDECLDNRNCSSNEYCANTDGIFACECVDGYYKDEEDDTCKLIFTIMGEFIVEQINGTAVDYSEDLADNSSALYKSYANTITQAADEVFGNSADTGHIYLYSEIVRFYSGSLGVEIAANFKAEQIMEANITTPIVEEIFRLNVNATEIQLNTESIVFIELTTKAPPEPTTQLTTETESTIEGGTTESTTIAEEAPADTKLQTLHIAIISVASGAMFLILVVGLIWLIVYCRRRRRHHRWLRPVYTPRPTDFNTLHGVAGEQALLGAFGHGWDQESRSGVSSDSGGRFGSENERRMRHLANIMKNNMGGALNERMMRSQYSAPVVSDRDSEAFTPYIATGQEGSEAGRGDPPRGSQSPSRFRLPRPTAALVDQEPVGVRPGRQQATNRGVHDLSQEYF